MPIDTPIHTSSQSIDRVLNAGVPVILVFWRRQCAPCQQLDPALDTVASEHAGRLLVAKIDADDEPELVKRFQVSQLPTLAFTRNGALDVTATGAIQQADLQRWSHYLIEGGSRPAVPSGPSVALRSGSSDQPGKKNGTPTGAPSPAGGKPITLTDANFDQVINGERPVLVDFWAPWCGPCHMVAPTIEALAQEFDGKLVVGKLNVDENQRTSGRYGIMSIPTMMIFRNGNVIDQVTGALPPQVLRARVLPYVN